MIHMVWKASEKDYAEFQKKKAAQSGGPAPKKAGQMQAWRSRKSRADEINAGAEESTKQKIIRGVVRAGSAAKRGINRYVSAREESHRRLDRATNEGRERVSDTWAGEPVRRSAPTRKRQSYRSGGSNDYYPVYLTNTLTGASYGGGLGMWGSSLPRGSTNPAGKRKKKTTKRKRRSYD